jgi:hypothetical protein
MPNAKQIDFLNSGMGAAYALGWVYAYESGTTTNKVIYTVADKSVNATAPFQLDASGRAEVYADGNYTFLIKDVNLANAITLDNMFYSITSQDNPNVVSVSADYTTTSADYLILVNTASGNVTIALVTAIGNSGLQQVIIKTSSDANTITAAASGTQTIAGIHTQTLISQYQTLSIMADGFNWQMTNSPGMVSLVGTETLTNKTLVTPVISTMYKDAAKTKLMTVPDVASDTFVVLDAIQKLTNKDLTDATNSLGITNPLPTGYISGLGISHAADTDHDLTIAIGKVRDGTDAEDEVLAAALTKQADATWVAGSNSGGMASGESLPTSGTIHAWSIMRNDKTVIDVMISNHATSGLAPAFPTNYGYKRRIASFRTDSSANIINGVQWGTGKRRIFMLNTPILDINNATPGTSAVTAALSVPNGISVFAILNVWKQTSGIIYLSSLDNTNVAPSISAAPLGLSWVGGTALTVRVKTNTSGQIRYRSDTDSPILIALLGWEDSL